MLLKKFSGYLSQFNKDIFLNNSTDSIWAVAQRGGAPSMGHEMQCQLGRAWSEIFWRYWKVRKACWVLESCNRVSGSFNLWGKTCSIFKHYKSLAAGTYSTRIFMLWKASKLEPYTSSSLSYQLLPRPSTSNVWARACIEVAKLLMCSSSATVTVSS